jgi:hypothetical protein
LGRICRAPRKKGLLDITKNAINRMSALTDGAMRQVRQTGLDEDAGSNSTETWAAGPLRPQKWAAWMLVDNRTQAKHASAIELNHFAGRVLKFKVFDTALELDAVGRLRITHPCIQSG